MAFMSQSAGQFLRRTCHHSSTRRLLKRLVYGRCPTGQPEGLFGGQGPVVELKLVNEPFVGTYARIAGANEKPIHTGDRVSRGAASRLFPNPTSELSNVIDGDTGLG